MVSVALWSTFLKRIRATVAAPVLSGTFLYRVLFASHVTSPLGVGTLQDSEPDIITPSDISGTALLGCFSNSLRGAAEGLEKQN